MTRYVDSSQEEIDGYWGPIESSNDPRTPWESVISRNVVKAMEDAESETNLDLFIDCEDDRNRKISVQWLGMERPNGRDIYTGSMSLSDVVDGFIHDHLMCGNNSENEELLFLAEELEGLTKKVRAKII